MITSKIIKRLFRVFGLILLASFLLFAVVEFLPGDAASVAVGKDGKEAVDAAREQMGLNDSICSRYSKWLIGITRGDLGKSLLSGVSVVEVLRIPAMSTLSVAGIVMVALLFITVPAALYLSYKKSALSSGLSTASVIISAMPEFVTALLLLVFLSLMTKCLPVISMPAPGKTVWDAPHTLIMPSLSLWIIVSANIYRRIRALVDTYSGAAYIREAMLCGLSQKRILFYHLLPSISTGLLQILAQVIPYLLGGAIVVETVATFPGMGSLLITAVSLRETPIVMGIGLFMMIATSISYTLADAIGHMSRGKGGII